ncbi:Lipase/lipooxygenase, PLAT/LH2 family protein [Trifolium repens]|nr:Lipase/lipooxygenase, PLAT/LH2 family protein [Trifolium repens]
METIPMKTMIPSTSLIHNHAFKKTTRITSTTRRRTSTQYKNLRFSIHAKFSDTNFQDFRTYARPSELFPASEVKVYTKTSLENILSSVKEDKSKSLFRVKLVTSNLYGSNISDFNAGILLCLIDEVGHSILKRIPVSLMTDDSTESGDILHFQRGSVDEFIFEGPKIARLEALWVGVESGQWRLGNISLIVMNSEWQPSLPEEEVPPYTGFQYDFPVEDVLLGEGTDVSMLELRPNLVTQLEGTDPISLFNKELYDGTFLPSPEITKEESMKEYTNLKFSLLFYDAVLILFGTTIASLSAGENTGFAFLIGGIGGFLYLLLLQRYVDGLPGSELITSNKRGTDALFKGLKGPIVSVALALGFAVLVVKYTSGDDIDVILTPKDIIVGMMGFLACKVSVVLAAFKPIAVGPEVTE